MPLLKFIYFWYWIFNHASADWKQNQARRQPEFQSLRYFNGSIHLFQLFQGDPQVMRKSQTMGDNM